MLDFNLIADFSYSHCIAICAFLVPMNLLATVQTMIFTGCGRGQGQVRLAAIVASLYALILVFHVFTWFVIGVIMAPTYILLVLGSVCLGINGWAIAHSLTMQRTLRLVAATLIGLKPKKPDFLENRGSL